MPGLTGRRAQPRRFQYHPRFYDPARDDAIKRRIRIQRPHERPKTRQPAFVAVALGLAAALYVYLNIERVVEGAASLGRVFFGG